MSSSTAHRHDEYALRAEINRLNQAISDMSARHREAIDVLKSAELRLAESLSRSEEETRTKMAFFASINHELRTPLNAIVGYSQILMDEMFGPLGNAKYREHTSAINQSALHLLGLANDLLDLARADVGDFRLQINSVDPGETIRSSVTILKGLAENAGVALLVDIDPQLPVIETDRGRLRQMVLNLASNAIKFTRRSGRVTVRATRETEKGVLILAISDNGSGMSSEDLQFVLRPFGQIRRITSTTSGNECGAGLGLPITRRLAELMGGSLEIASQLGVGTIVTVRLPLRPLEHDRSHVT